jgi:hypothetical protein
VTCKKTPARRCSWRHCTQPAAATVAFKLPNLLAGSRRDYCTTHAAEACSAQGTKVVARLGPRQPALPGGAPGRRTEPAPQTYTEGGVMP